MHRRGHYQCIHIAAVAVAASVVIVALAAMIPVIPYRVSHVLQMASRAEGPVLMTVGTQSSRICSAPVPGCTPRGRRLVLAGGSGQSSACRSLNYAVTIKIGARLIRPARGRRIRRAARGAVILAAVRPGVAGVESPLDFAVYMSAGGSVVTQGTRKRVARRSARMFNVASQLRWISRVRSVARAASAGGGYVPCRRYIAAAVGGHRRAMTVNIAALLEAAA